MQAVITAPEVESVGTQIYCNSRQIAEHSEVEIKVANYVGGTDKALCQIENCLQSALYR